MLGERARQNVHKIEFHVVDTFSRISTFFSEFQKMLKLHILVSGKQILDPINNGQPLISFRYVLTLAWFLGVSRVDYFNIF